MLLSNVKKHVMKPMATQYYVAHKPNQCMSSQLPDDKLKERCIFLLSIFPEISYELDSKHHMIMKQRDSSEANEAVSKKYNWWTWIWRLCQKICTMLIHMTKQWTGATEAQKNEKSRTFLGSTNLDHYLIQQKKTYHCLWNLDKHQKMCPRPGYNCVSSVNKVNLSAKQWDIKVRLEPFNKI